MAVETHGPGGGSALSQRVRDAVVEVLREVRDAPGEPFEGELGLALVLHAWAHLASGGMQPHAFAIVAYGPAGARYEAVSVDAFEVEAVRLARLDAALDALLVTSREVAAVLVAVPTRVTAGASLGALPFATHVRVDDGGARSSHVLFTDGRCAGAGCMTAIERRGDAWCLVDGAPPQPVPETFVAAIGGFPWARAPMRSAIDQEPGRRGPASPRSETG